MSPCTACSRGQGSRLHLIYRDVRADVLSTDPLCILSYLDRCQRLVSSQRARGFNPLLYRLSYVGV